MNSSLNIVFMGTPQFSVPCLHSLLDADDINLLAVLTQPDRPSGRGQKLTPPPVKALAEAHGLAVHQPEKLRTDEGLIQHLRDLQPDFLVTIAFGQILPQAVLDIPKYGTVNVHASLLPKYRGANPIQWAILNGEAETGLTTMLTEIGVDTGPMLLTHREAIHPTDTAVDMHDRLSVAAGPLLLATLRQLASGELTPTPQNDADATHAPKLAKTDAELDWTQPATHIDLKIRGQQPWPGTVTTFAGQPVKVLASQLHDADAPATQPPGNIVGPHDNGLLVQCGTGTVVAHTLQPAGKSPMSAASWFNGLRDIQTPRFGG